MKLYGLTAIPTSGLTVSQITGGLPVTGDIVKVAVIDSLNNALLLEMSNGVILEAHFENSELTASKGDQLLLHVHDIKDGILYARIINTDKENKDKPSYIDKANETLTRLNLQKSDINIRIASELIKSGIEVTRETIQNLAAVFSRFGPEGIKAAVLLLSGGGKIDNQTIENLILVHKGALKLDGFIEYLEQSIEGSIQETSNKENPIKEIPAKEILIEEAPEIAGKDDLQAFLSEFKRVFSRPGELGYNLPRIKEIYEEIINSIRAFTASPANKADSAINTPSGVETLERAVRFLMDISEYIPYFQVPVQLEDSYTTGELYIMRRKKSVKTGATFTVLLSLTTLNMGSIDALIEFYGRNLRLSFRVDNNNIRDFVNGYKEKIVERLKGLNYIVTSINCETGSEVSLLDIPDFISARTERGTVIDYRV